MLYHVCRTCAEYFDLDTDNTLKSLSIQHSDGTKEKITHPSQVCKHTSEERRFRCVMDTDELAHALEKGYKVTRIYHALVWPEVDEDGPRWSTELFKSTFLWDFTGS